jgi:hypothetical protein
MHRSRLLALMVCLLALGCSRVLPHDFSPKDARDYEPCCHDGDPAILLIPANTLLVEPISGIVVDESLGRRHERYEGPARIFLPPGRHQYLLKVTTVQGGAEFDLALPVEAGARYQLEIIESAETVTTAVLKLSEEAYRALYPNR